MRYSVFPLVFLILSSCKILHSPKVTTSGCIEGLTHKDSNYIDKENFIIMHGIGSKENNYSETLIERLNTFKFGKNKFKCTYSVYKNGEFIAVQDMDLRRIYETYNNNGGVEALKIVAYDPSRKDIQKNVFYSINWAVAVQESKDSLVDTEINNSPFYLGVNKMLKKMVMMRRVSDAFAGSKPEIIQKLHRLLCRIIIDGKLFEAERLNVITGSFGTQLTLSLLNDIQEQEQSKILDKGDFIQILNSLEKANGIGIEAYKQLLIIKPTLKLKLFSLSNQLSLMPNNIKGWIPDFNRNTSKLNFGSVQITAFRNPNDILCYYMPEEKVKQFFPKQTGLKVINTYYFNWPIKNDVMNAHTIVFKSKKLAKIIYYGTASNWTRVKKDKFQ